MLYGTVALNYQTRRFLSQQPRSLGSLLKLTLPTTLSVAASARLYYAHFLGGNKY